MYKNKSARNARARKDSQLERRRRNCRGDCRDSRARRSAHRCARRRVSTAPVTERLHTSLTEWQTGLPHDPPVRANRTACEKLSQLKEVNNTSVERTTLELQLCETAVYASLAPAHPPPPAGLASSPLVCSNVARFWSQVGPLLVPSWSPFGPKLVPFWSQVYGPQTRKQNKNFLGLSRKTR